MSINSIVGLKSQVFVGDGASSETFVQLLDVAEITDFPFRQDWPEAFDLDNMAEERIPGSMGIDPIRLNVNWNHELASARHKPTEQFSILHKWTAAADDEDDRKLVPNIQIHLPIVDPTNETRAFWQGPGGFSLVNPPLGRGTVIAQCVIQPSGFWAYTAEAA